MVVMAFSRIVGAASVALVHPAKIVAPSCAAERTIFSIIMMSLTFTCPTPAARKRGS